MRHHYKQVTQKSSRHFSEWRPIPGQYFQECCGCGLVHEWRFSWGKQGKKTILGKRLRVHLSETGKAQRRLKRSG